MSDISREGVKAAVKEEVSSYGVELRRVRRKRFQDVVEICFGPVARSSVGGEAQRVGQGKDDKTVERQAAFAVDRLLGLDLFLRDVHCFLEWAGSVPARFGPRGQFLVITSLVAYSRFEAQTRISSFCCAVYSNATEPVQTQSSC